MCYEILWWTVYSPPLFLVTWLTPVQFIIFYFVRQIRIICKKCLSALSCQFVNLSICINSVDTSHFFMKFDFGDCYKILSRKTKFGED